MDDKPDFNHWTFQEIVDSPLTFQEIEAQWDEETAINAGIARDPDSPEWTEEDFTRARPAVEVDGLLVKLTRRPRGKQKLPTKERITIRIDADLVEHYRATGPGWQSRINKILRQAAFGAADNQ